MAVASKLIFISGAKLADRLLKAGIPLIDQGVEVNGTRCFVFEVQAQHVAAARKLLGPAYV